MQYVQKFGTKQWARIAQVLPKTEPIRGLEGAGEEATMSALLGALLSHTSTASSHCVAYTLTLEPPGLISATY